VKVRVDDDLLRKRNAFEELKFFRSFFKEDLGRQLLGPKVTSR
jgi:hypothetical protein